MRPSPVIVELESIKPGAYVHLKGQVRLVLDIRLDFIGGVYFAKFNQENRVFRSISFDMLFGEQS
jgi:hypothetical protein